MRFIQHPDTKKTGSPYRTYIRHVRITRALQVRQKRLANFLASLARDNANVNLVEKRKFKTDATAPYESCVIASVVHGFIVLLVIKKYAGLHDRLDHSLKWLLLRSAMLERNLGKGGVVCLSVRPSVRLSVTRWRHLKTNHRMTWFLPRDAMQARP